MVRQTWPVSLTFCSVGLLACTSLCSNSKFGPISPGFSPHLEKAFAAGETAQEEYTKLSSAGSVSLREPALCPQWTADGSVVPQVSCRSVFCFSVPFTGCAAVLGWSQRSSTSHCRVLPSALCQMGIEDRIPILQRLLFLLIQSESCHPDSINS